jgi:hypothetical protein
LRAGGRWRWKGAAGGSIVNATLLGSICEFAGDGSDGRKGGSASIDALNIFTHNPLINAGKGGGNGAVGGAGGNGKRCRTAAIFSFTINLPGGG